MNFGLSSACELLVTAVRFDKAIAKLDRPVARRILSYLDDIVALDDPRSRGKGLTGPLAGYWRYRIGDYRVLVRVVESEAVVVALDTSHRSGGIYD